MAEVLPRLADDESLFEPLRSLREKEEFTAMSVHLSFLCLHVDRLHALADGPSLTASYQSTVAATRAIVLGLCVNTLDVKSLLGDYVEVLNGISSFAKASLAFEGGEEGPWYPRLVSFLWHAEAVLRAFMRTQTRKKSGMFQSIMNARILNSKSRDEGDVLQRYEWKNEDTRLLKLTGDVATDTLPEGLQVPKEALEEALFRLPHPSTDDVDLKKVQTKMRQVVFAETGTLISLMPLATTEAEKLSESLPNTMRQFKVVLSHLLNLEMTEEVVASTLATIDFLRAFLAVHFGEPPKDELEDEIEEEPEEEDAQDKELEEGAGAEELKGAEEVLP